MIAYFIDHITLQVKDVINLTKYTLDIDEEVKSKSVLMIHRAPVAEAEDFVIIKNKSTVEYYGILASIENENGESLHKLNLLHISNMFNRKVLLSNGALISSTGIEDFIKYTIENDFSASSDAFINKSYIDVTALTHTPIQRSVDTSDGVYNFHTYITNAKQNYDINMSYVFEDAKLKIGIYKEIYSQEVIDTDVSDVMEYFETREVKYTAKVTVKEKATSTINSWYLQSDRTVTDDAESATRVTGAIDVVTCETVADMEQTALNVFKSNSYRHFVEFRIKRDSKLINVDALVMGTPIKLKTKSNGVFDSYISGKVIDSDNSAVYFKCGNLRVTLTDKLRKGL